MESPDTLLQTPAERGRVAHDPPRARILESPPRTAAGRGEQLVAGRYRLLQRLGAGGFGEVWRARDEQLHREVAVKRVRLGPDGDSERAAREALASARLSHPAIVALFEAFAVEDSFYLVSELVEGETLAALIADGGPPDEEILEIGVALAGALAHAHARGVIHRDIKPQNVLVPDHARDAIDAAKLTDFGGASLVGEDALTRTGDVLGTLAYMAPEQSEGREVAEEADLYALALVLYEAFAGVNPVRGATPAATARRIGRRVEPLERRRRDLPRGLTRAVDAALSPAPRQRGTLEDLHDALAEALQRGLPRGRRAVRRGPPPVLAADLRAPSATEVAPQPPRRRLRAAPAQIAPAAAALAPSVPEVPPARDEEPAARSRGLPRALWLACALAAIGWQVWIGSPGVALLLAAALAPLLALPRRSGGSWLVCALAPALGVVGLAGAFPALAGQPRGWRERATLGALGYWWLTLAQPLLARDLWLGAPAGTPARGVWEASLSSTAAHVIAPVLGAGVLLGVLLWGLAATVLPWVVRGRSAALDIVAATVWSAALLTAAPLLDGGLAAQPQPRGAVLGAVLGGTFAVAARALRGPV